jgi:hypothetical protein
MKGKNMVVQKNKIVLAISIISIGLPSLVLFANQADMFVVKKKKVTVSKSKLKEHNVELLTNLLQTLPAYIKTIADVQEIAMDKVGAYIEGQKNCFWTDASSERLDECVSKLETVQKQLAQMHNQLRECVTFLHNL